MFRVLIILALFVQVTTAQVVRLYPVDDTARDSDFRSYVGKLRSAVEGRNTSALRKLVDAEVTVGPAKEDKGWSRFVAKWRPDDRESPLWPALADLLSVGFIREHPNLYLSPYLVWRFPDELNRASHLVIVRDSVPLRGAPSLNAPAIAQLSFDVVRRLGAIHGEDRLNQWFRVSTLDERTGYVNARDVMSPMMPRAQFGLQKGRWLLLALED